MKRTDQIGHLILLAAATYDFVSFSLFIFILLKENNSSLLSAWTVAKIAENDVAMVSVGQTAFFQLCEFF